MRNIQILYNYIVVRKCILRWVEQYNVILCILTNGIASSEPEVDTYAIICAYKSNLFKRN